MEIIQPGSDRWMEREIMQYNEIRNHREVLGWERVSVSDGFRYSTCAKMPDRHWDVCIYIILYLWVSWGLPWWLSGKESACNAGDSGDLGSIPGSGRSPGGENGNSFQYSHLGDSMNTGACRVRVHGSQRVEQDWAQAPTPPSPHSD